MGKLYPLTAAVCMRYSVEDTPQSPMQTVAGQTRWLSDGKARSYLRQSERCLQTCFYTR